MKYLNTLNSAQRQAAEHIHGPLLILAGAGAGKTKTLTHRILHLIMNGVQPSSILAVTFTNKAAREMRERLELLLRQELGHDDPHFSLPLATTFHSLGVRLARENHALLGLPPRFTILDRDDSKKIVREALEDLGMSSKEYDPGKILALISKQKMKGMIPKDFEADFHNPVQRTLKNVWAKYEEKTKEKGALDFDDLLLQALLLLRNNKEVRARYHARWTHLHIDEYQDTNDVQYEIALLLTGREKNVCVVGDADQNIYSWRGANIKNILSFEDDYAGARVVLLEENYRSTKTIIAAANDIIKKNTMRKEKNLFTNNADGEKIKMFTAGNETEEARRIAEKAKECIAAGQDPNEIAVLYRANFQSRVLEEAFLKEQVPYELLGTRFFERAEVKDVLSYLRAALNPKSTLDIARAVQTPRRGIGKTSLLKLLQSGPEVLGGKAKVEAARFMALLEEIRQSAVTMKPSDLLKLILQKSGIEMMYKSEGTEDAQDRLQNIYELISLASRYDHLPPEEALTAFMDDAALASDQDELDRKKGGVKLMTVHASKGLEFDTVFLPGLEEGLFPMRRGESKEEEEEERRLFYVALTRARKELILSHASERTIFGSQNYSIPSEFLLDIDEGYIEREEGGSKRGYLDDLDVVYIDF